MSEEQQKHPLHGVSLKAMLIELVSHYDWPILAEQVPLKCFDSYPTIAAAVKFLHKTPWARQRVEAFYLYRLKAISLPSDEQHSLPPREREISLDELGKEPIEVLLGDPEFFDDPASGPVFPSKKSVEQTRANSKKHAPTKEKRSRRDVAQPAVEKLSRRSEPSETSNDSSSDPWAKWRKD